ncbi:MAG: hypothetical protein ABIP48_03475 [Planctomycetota bacterium]
MVRILLLLLLLWVVAAVSLQPASGEQLLVHGTFEDDFGDDGLGVGWTDNSRSWADLEVEYRRSTDRPHGGEACQQIVCTRLDYGAVQMTPTTPVPLDRGGIYRVQGWLRGDVGPVALQLRQSPSPYRVYVEEAVEVGDEWRKIDYFWTSTVGDPNGRFMLRFTKEGNLWVDDLSIEAVSAEEASRRAPPPERGNLLANGQFDLGPAGWLLNHSCDAWREAVLEIDAVEGEPCLKITVPEGITATLSSDVTPIASGHPITVGCRLRADGPASVTFGSTNCGGRADVTTEWRAFTAAGKARFVPRPADHVRLVVRGPVRLWIDDVRLYQDLGPGDGRRFQAVVLSDRHPLSLYHEGEPPIVGLFSSTPQGTEPRLLEWKIEDFWGNVRLEGTCHPGAGRRFEKIDCHELGRGWYRASVGWIEDGRPQAHESTFVVLPPPDREGSIAESPFGAHFSLDPTGLRIAQAVGARWLRLHPPNHTKWRIVEPDRKGEWAWRDEPIRIAKKAGLELIGSLDRCPNWASSAPAGTPDAGFYTGVGAWVPENWSDWENYVRETVRRYKGDVHVWEVWNEPNLTDWLIPRAGQTRAEAYVEMLKRTYPIVKREDPSATVIGGCVAGALTEHSPPWQFTREIIDLGALELMDAFSFHQYITRSVDEGDEPIETWLGRLKRMMREAGRPLPIINSEGGYANPGTSLRYRPCPANVVSPDDMARWLVRQYVSQIACGVRQFFFYNFFVDGSPTIRPWEGFVEGDGQPRPNVAAYAQMTWALDGSRFERIGRPHGDVSVYHFTTPRGRLAVAWAHTGRQAVVEFTGAVRAWDLMGSPLDLPSGGKLEVTDAPVYVLTR